MTPSPKPSKTVATSTNVLHSSIVASAGSRLPLRLLSPLHQTGRYSLLCHPHSELRLSRASATVPSRVPRFCRRESSVRAPRVRRPPPPRHVRTVRVTCAPPASQRAPPPAVTAASRWRCPRPSTDPRSPHRHRTRPRPRCAGHCCLQPQTDPAVAAAAPVTVRRAWGGREPAARALPVRPARPTPHCAHTAGAAAGHTTPAPAAVSSGPWAAPGGGRGREGAR